MATQELWLCNMTTVKRVRKRTRNPGSAEDSCQLKTVYNIYFCLNCSVDLAVRFDLIGS